MMNSFTNSTNSSNKTCEYEPNQIMALALVDIVTLLMGQPVIVKLLLITFTSKKTTDILNFNLALFHNFQYLISILHLIFVLVRNPHHQLVAEFLLVYVQIGAPTGLSFICLERYVAVIHPTSYPLLKKYRFREVCALTVWLLSVPAASLSVLVVNPTFFLLDHMSTNLSLSFMLVMAAAMVWCSVRIAMALKKSSPGRDELHPVKRRALRTVCATSIITMFCYVPVTLMQAFSSMFRNLSECMLTSIYILFLSVASVVHTVLYLATQGQLFTYLKALYSACRALA